MASSLNAPLLCFLILFLPSVCVFAQTRNSNLSVGDSFIAGNGNTPWVVSPSGDFAFGFQPLKNSNSLFLLSIWYANIPNTTIVWYANGDNPAPRGSRVQVTASEGLKLTSPDGQTLWTSENTPSGRVASGALNDFGNFVLQDRSSTSVWETFKDPKDTMLPSQTLGKGGKLSSRKLEADFAQGRFQLVLQDEGNLVMHSINLPSEYANENYFDSKTVESDTSSPGTQLVFNKSGDFYVSRENNDTYTFSNQNIPSQSQFYLRVTLNFDGVLTFYQHPRRSYGNETWTPIWSKPDNICSATIKEGAGICGYNSFCRLGENSRPNCQCPPGYSLLDPEDPYGSCKPDFIQGCKEDELSQGKDLYDFKELIDTDWPLSDYALLKPFTEEKCKQACLEDCFCAVAIFRSGDSCWKKRWPLSNGRVDTSLNFGKALIKVRKDNSSLSGPPGPPIIKRKNQDTLILVVSVLLGSSAILNLVLTGAFCLGFSSIYQLRKKLKSVYRSDSAVETNLRCFTYKELEEATNGFKEELGRGAFGVVYKGAIVMGPAVPVAVKRLNTFLLQETEKEFKNEVNVIGQTHHKNLVRLLGFCEEGNERLLVYECMSNGTLASLLFRDSRPNWNLRLKMAFGIARGLVYLHEDCGTQIIHCDIKPQNILLDDYFNARISDFGLSKLLNMNQSRTHTAIRGTKGYVALEWFKNMPITAKVDVYSFGVLLLEIVCCRRNVDMEPENEERAILTDWAYDCYTTGSLEALVEQDHEALNDKENLERLVMVAIWCTQEDPTVRPTMRKVSQMLEGVAEVPAPPCQIVNSVTRDHYYSPTLEHD
ncbi:G-type lectin S-receptor-like serine/threonine-protein kinase LECRK3 [Prosopis cineraria]|uniref:G-type lectin S-receptor-like serine/threonine-protein kinase LECRK3 n=1 Tax=Prosopis cineraria TaxID=364024 RepID=UPI00241054EC|nr:G-type lectin S-receptor-like serine/threonine-protein kinase LECRK3 [Prosopis cineraria]